MSKRHLVAEENDFISDDRMIVEVEGIEIGVIRYDGSYYAVQNHCAHDGGPVCKGLVQGVLDGDWDGPGERVDEYFSDTPAIACPWHGWEYELETGEHVGDQNVQIRTFDVEIEDGNVYVIV